MVYLLILAKLLLMFQLLLISQSRGIDILKELEAMHRLFGNLNESSPPLDKLTEIFGNLQRFTTTTTASIMKQRFNVENTGTTQVMESTKYPRYIPVMNPGSRHTHSWI